MSAYFKLILVQKMLPLFCFNSGTRKNLIILFTYKHGDNMFMKIEFTVIILLRQLCI